jgi:hypothetical protein
VNHGTMSKFPRVAARQVIDSQLSTRKFHIDAANWPVP